MDFFIAFRVQLHPLFRAGCGQLINGDAIRVKRAKWVATAALLLAVSAASAAEIALSREEASRIGRKIWQNECGGTVAGLTSWNTGEDFASLGIGHFIWYPEGKRGPFEESFPLLVQFMRGRGAKLPALLLDATGCPWESRSEFLAAEASPAMKELRKILAQTVDLQAEFLVRRLREALPKILARAPVGDRQTIKQRFDRVASSPRGEYALVDYVNFKGEGVLQSERYRGQGWGLLQVLEEMSDSGDPVDEFSAAAAAVLRRRVQNAPQQRQEKRWLAGWLNRLETYR